ncbi:MAG: M48 family metalloprotease [Pyrinomonadaceae bacterium]
MKWNQLFYSFGLLVLFVAISLSQPQVRERDPAKEAPVLQELQKIAPKAVDLFKTATQNLDNDNEEEAIRQYNEVLKQAPNFEPALRRLGYALIATGKHAEGIAMAQKAVDFHRSADNLLGLSVAIVSPGNDNYLPPDSEIMRALTLAKESSKLSNGSDSDTLGMIAQLSLALNKIEDFNSAVGQMQAGFPDLVQTHYFYAIRHADQRDFDGAIVEVKTAETQGLDSEEANRLIAAIEKGKDEAYPLAKYLKYIYAFLGVVALWMLGLLGLFVGGKSMSAKTLKAIEKSDPDDITGGGHTSLKAAYRRLITFAGLYYYISQPIVVALVIVGTATLVYGFFLIGRIPIAFLIGLVFVGGGSIFFMFKSLVVRQKVEDLGRVLDQAEAPELWELVRTVAGDINTRPIDEIRVTPGVEMAVYERGSWRQKLQDKGERVLILGAGSFDGFSTNAFRAVLAHEYGHFSNRDTAGGDVAFRVNSDMMRLAEAMVNAGSNTYHNLAFHFLRLYHFIFRRITHGASRLQEALADRVAVHNYGAAAFAEGLEHVIRQKIVFDRLANAEISSALAARRKFENLYDLKLEDDSTSDVETAFRTEFDRPTGEDDTHPAGADRVRLAQKVEGQTHENIKGLVWDFFADRDEFTKGMSLLIEKQIRGERYSNYHDTGISEAGN